MADKDRITCHILDTTAGRPAKGVNVRLVGPATTSTFSTASPSPGANLTHTFEASTDEDGRVKLWKPLGGPVGLEDLLKTVEGSTRWTLYFDTEGYFGPGKTFFPEATVVFRVEEGQTYHVPLLLSPFTYTTYRGS